MIFNLRFQVKKKGGQTFLAMKEVYSFSLTSPGFKNIPFKMKNLNISYDVSCMTTTSLVFISRYWRIRTIPSYLNAMLYSTIFERTLLERFEFWDMTVLPLEQISGSDAECGFPPWRKTCFHLLLFGIIYRAPNFGCLLTQKVILKIWKLFLFFLLLPH